MKKAPAARALQTLSARELRARAGELNISRRHSMKKAELISAITAALQSPGAERPKKKAIPRRPLSDGQTPPPVKKSFRSRRLVPPVAEVTAMVVDQHTIHCYWNGAPENKQACPPAVKTVLRVQDLTGRHPHGPDAVPTYDIGIAGAAGSRSIELPHAGHAYRVDLGVLDATGFRPLAGASAVRLPPAAPARETDAAWNIPGGDFQRLYELSGARLLRLGGRAAAHESLSSPGLDP